MTFSSPTAHSLVASDAEHQAAIATALAAAPISTQLAPAGPVSISLGTVSVTGSFDAYIQVGYGGTATEPLVLDSGNNTLIMPHFETLQALPNFGHDYQVLQTGIAEPWGCPANIVQGPIYIPTTTGLYELPNCVFYACTADNNGGRTANFGLGCVSPWTQVKGIEMRAPLTYAANPFAEVNYVDADSLLSTSGAATINLESTLNLYDSIPTGYQMLAILPNLEWMSVRPISLSIGEEPSGWPGAINLPIAMVDTGGGPVFLSDPNGAIYNKTTWPNPVSNPDWVSNGSVSCQSFADALTIELGDGTSTYTYSIAASIIPAGTAGQTLVACRTCSYMEGQPGMNIGGLSAVFNYILIDYSGSQVGFKSKTPIQD